MTGGRGRRALVVGGGIAGPVTAVALARAGFEPAVFEAYDRAADGVGAYLTLAINGLDALAALGLRDEVMAAGFSTPRVSFVNGAGRTLGEAGMGGPLPDGTTTQTIRRADIHRALRDATARAGVPIHYGHRLAAAEATAAGVTAVFDNGVTAEGDLLIGADGLHSAVRPIIDPGAPRATYQGLLNTAGIARDVPVDTEPGLIRMVFGKRCFFSYVAHPDGSVWWFANPVYGHDPSERELGRIRKHLRQILLDLVAPDYTPAARIVAATDHIHPPYGTYYFPRVPTWHRDNMIIIGDAAHASPRPRARARRWPWRTA